MGTIEKGTQVRGGSKMLNVGLNGSWNGNKEREVKVVCRDRMGIC